MSALLVPEKELWTPSNTLVVKGGIRGSVLTPGKRGISPGQPSSGGPGGGRGHGKGGGGSGGKGGGVSLITDLVSAYEFNGNGNDLHGTNDLASVGTPAYVAGKPVTGADLERGDVDYFTINDNPSLSITGPIEITAWVNPEATGPVAGYGIVCKGRQDEGDLSYALRLSTFSTQFNFQVSNNGTTITGGTDGANVLSATFTYGQWHFVDCWWDGSLIHIRVNNDIPGEVTQSFTTSILNSAAKFQVGASNDNNPFDGIIGQVLVYNGNLTNAKRLFLYGAGNGKEYSTF